MSQPNPDPLSGRILTLRGQRVILDADLARLYGTTTKAFNQAFKRNAGRFPKDFAFQLTKAEADSLRSQIVTLNAGHGWEGKRNRSQSVTSSATGRGAHRKYRPWAFTEHGAVMAANVLRSQKAMQMSVYVVRAFIRQREALMANATIFQRLAEIDKTLLEHNAALLSLWKKLRPLLTPPEVPRKEMGFHTTLRKP